jgi:hypothetical protein
MTTFQHPTPVLQIGGQSRLKTVAQVINLLQAAYCTETRTFSTQLPNGQDSKLLISSATTTRINPNLQSESLLELSGFQDI